MIVVTVFKDELKWSSDLRKSALKCGLNSGNKNAWNEAKEMTSKVDYTQSIKPHQSFFDKDTDKKVRDIGHAIANGRNYRVELV